MKIPEKIEMPAPTAWPLVLAFGLTLVFAGMVTAASVSILGAILTVAGAVGWFRQVLPVESHEWAPVVQEEIAIETSRESVERIDGRREIPRAWLPVEIYPISAGVKGGLAGGAAMAVLAAVYGILERQRNLVSDESAGRRTVSHDGDGDCQPDRNIPSSTVPGRRSDAPADLAAGWTALWRDAADGSAAPDSVGRFRGAAAVVRS